MCVIFIDKNFPAWYNEESPLSLSPTSWRWRHPPFDKGGKERIYNGSFSPLPKGDTAKPTAEPRGILIKEWIIII